MKKITLKPLVLLLLIASAAIFYTCNRPATSTSNMEFKERPNDPWVFRSVLDSLPRMVTLALDEDLWVAYDTDQCAVYKVWEKGVNFDGAVYTTVHGPQPTILGNYYIDNEYPQPWKLIQNGQEKKVIPLYRGHRFVNGHAQLMYDIDAGGGNIISLTEQAEFSDKAQKKVGFERMFTTTNVPEGTQVVIMLNASSIMAKEDIVTDGEYTIESTTPRKMDMVEGVDVKGKLHLKSNGSTTFTTNFLKTAMVNNPRQADKVDDRPEGLKLIARSDCKTCHNTVRQTVGPAYMEIAKRYLSTEGNIAYLVNKVKNGGAGVWGQAAMSPHPDLGEDKITVMVDYILALDTGEDEGMDVAGGDEKATADATPIGGAFQEGDEAIKMDDKKLLPGVIVKIYDFEEDLFNLPEIPKDMETVFEGVIPTIHADAGDLKDFPDNAVMIATGYLNIPRNTNYDFRLISDDGSRFTLDGNVLITHDGLHGADAKDGEIALKEGLHPFKLEYFQGYGGKSISLQWAPHGSGKFSVIPADVYLYDRNLSQSAATFADASGVPGDGASLMEVHPSYNLSQARPETFLPKVGGIDFLPDGRMVVSTWDPVGGVHIVAGHETGDPAKMTLKTIAKGLAEPLGLKVVDGNLYVLQKQELTQLIDNNGDDIIDEYRTVCKGWHVSGNFHEFAFGLAEKDGYLYAALATAIQPGGASTNPQILDRGKAIKINPKDGAFEFIAHGLRTPNGVGIGVDGEVFITDNQGDWLPASKVVHVQKDAWFGSRSVDFEGTASLTETKPVVWLPQNEIGNSPSQVVPLNHGPYKGQMLHGEVTHGGLKRVFAEKVNGQYQGALFRFTQGLEAGINRVAINPKDGSIYVGGVGSTGNWGHAGKLWYGLQRLQYNEKPTFEMLAVRAKSNGVEIEFTEPLKVQDGTNPADYLVRTWWYKPTEEYGGPKMEERPLKVKSASVSIDRKKVFLELDGMKDNHLVYIRLKNPFISQNGNGLWTTECWYTMNNIPQNNAGKVSTLGYVPQTDNGLIAAERDAGWELLFDGKTLTGWRNFKKEGIGSSWVVMDDAIHLRTFTDKDGNRKALDGGDIISDRKFENFELNLDWKIQDCGNSGIMFNVVESEEYDYVWQTGPEMQVLDNRCHPDAKFVTHQAGDLYDMIACKYLTVKPAGEWNKVRLIVNNGHVEHWLNGYKVVEYQMFDNNWAEMIANSKFKDMPGFGKAKLGHLSLQDHSDGVWFKNIKIREIKPNTQP